MEPAAVRTGCASMLLAALLGCTPAPLVVREVVAPEPGGAAASGAGALLVYTATRVSGYTLNELPVHMNYQLYSPDGSVREIENRGGAFGQAPVALRWPPATTASRAWRRVPATSRSRRASRPAAARWWIWRGWALRARRAERVGAGTSLCQHSSERQPRGQHRLSLNTL